MNGSIIPKTSAHQVYARLPQSKQCGIGTLRSDDEDGRENVAAKMNLPIKLCRVYVDPLNLPNQGDFSWS